LGDKVRIRCSSMGKGTSNSVEFSMGKKVPTGKRRGAKYSGLTADYSKFRWGEGSWFRCLTVNSLASNRATHQNFEQTIWGRYGDDGDDGDDGVVPDGVS
jgi:hypothetical protein